MVVLVKICGLREAESIRAAEESGADFLGFVFVRGRRRYLAPEVAAPLIAGNVRRAKTVGVFIDEEAATVNAIAERCRLDYVQLHGHESADYARQIARPIIRALKIGDDFSVDAANRYPAELILLDSGAGSGVPFRWREVAEAVPRIKRPTLIAGGISAANVAEMVRTLRPAGVDASGSLEIDGAKSPKLIREFMDTMRRLPT